MASAEVGAAKPDPAIFAAGLALAGVPAAGAVHAGDTSGPTSPGRAPRACAPCSSRARAPPPPPGVPVVATLDGLLMT